MNLWYVLIFCIGFLIGILVSTILTVSGNSERVQEAYDKGVEDGKNSALKDINNLYNKYKNMADEHNDIRC